MNRKNNKTIFTKWDFIREITKKNVNYLRIFTKLKNHASTTDIQFIFDKFHTNKSLNKYFYQNNFPNSYSELNFDEYQTYPKSYEKEIIWYLLSINKYSEYINQYVKLKKEFEDLVMLGKFEDALNILDYIDKNICFSIWSLENRFLILELTGGIENNKSYLSDIFENKYHIITTYFAYYFSLRAETNYSVFRINNQIKEFTEELEKNNLNLANYFKFKLNFIDNLNLIDINSVLLYESNNSLIDKYNTLMRLITNSISNKENTLNRILESTIIKLNNNINDQNIKNIIYLLNIDDITHTQTNCKDVINIYDLYTIGDYANCIQECSKYLLNEPSDINIYIIYIKCLINSNLSFKKFIDNNCILNDILAYLYNIFIKNESTFQSISDLYKISNKLYSFPAYFQLTNILVFETDGIKQDQINRNALLTSNFINPEFYTIFNDFDKAIKFLYYLKNTNNDSITALFFLNLCSIQKDVNFNNEINESLIPYYRLNYYKAKIYYERKEYEHAIELLVILIKDKSLSIVTQQSVINLLYRSYFENDNFDECLNLFCCIYFENNNLTLKLDYISIINLIKNNSFNNIRHDIILPLFFSFTKQDDHFTYVTVELFLDSLNILRPSQIDIKKNNLDNRFLIYFLNFICTTDVLKYSPDFDNQKDLYNERIKILSLLSEIDKDNIDIYKNLSKNISKELIIEDTIKHIDESKIYVDINGIFSSELNDLEEVFNRNLTLSNLAQDKQLKLINEKVNLLKLIKKDRDGSLIFIADPKFDYFTDILLEVRNSFLFSNKYGLDAYLSTRIRHGTLLGQIRSQFQNQHLLTQKDIDSDIYLTNEHWNDKFNISDKSRKLMQKHLSTFSRNIDNLIYKLKDEIIQIRTENKDNSGLFNYTFDSLRLFLVYETRFKNIDTFPLFINECFKYLWELTENNLIFIRQYINNDFKNEIIKNLDELHTNLHQINECNVLNEIFINIINCKTNIQSGLSSIAEWFNRKEDLIIDNFNIDKVIDTCLKITNNISPNYKIINLSKKINCNVIFNGKYFNHFIDLINLLFNNITTHSKLDFNDLVVNLDINLENNILKIKIINNISDLINIDTLKNTLKTKSNQLLESSTDFEIAKREGGSGFFKIKKIILFDLQNIKNSFNFNLNKENNFEAVININIEKLII